MKKIILAVMTAVMLMGTLAGCGTETSNLTGSCEEILAQVYEKADLNEDMRGALEYFQTMPIDDASEAYILGTNEVQYTDSVYSAPAMTSVAYQCVVLRLAEGQDVDEAKRLLSENADTRKWICVEAESVVVENIGDVVLYIMADTATAEAVKSAFLEL